MTTKIDLLKLDTGTTGLSASNIYKDSNNVLKYDSASEGLKTFGSLSQTCIISNNTAGNGGTLTANTDYVRVLNTTTLSQPWASLSSNVITIDGSTYPGTYFFKWKSITHMSGRTVSWLYNGTSNTPGMTGFSTTSTNSVISYGAHIEALTASTNYTLYTRGDNTRATDGLGLDHTGSDTNVYAEVIIQKID